MKFEIDVAFIQAIFYFHFGFLDFLRLFAVNIVAKWIGMAALIRMH